MKATLGLLAAYILYLVFILVSRLMVGNYLVSVGTSIFLAICIVLVVFCWTEKPQAYAASAIAGIAFVAISALAVSPGTAMNTEDAIWMLIISQVLPILVALESFKAYTELKSVAEPKSPM